jgi:hypothetical protein
VSPAQASSFRAACSAKPITVSMCSLNRASSGSWRCRKRRYIVLYWLPNAAASTARLYWEDRQSNARNTGAREPNPVPAGFSIFPGEAVQASRRWVERRYATVLHYARLDRGGHFAALEQPAVLTDRVRTTFRSTRASRPARVGA